MNNHAHVCNFMLVFCRRFLSTAVFAFVTLCVGTLANAGIAITASPNDFASNTVFQTSYVTLTVTNLGVPTATLGVIGNGGSSKIVFSGTQNGNVCVNGTVLPTGNFCTLIVEASSGTTGTYSTIISVASDQNPATKTLNFTVTPAVGPFAYVPNDVGDSVSVVALTSQSVIATITVGDGPYGVAVSPSGNFAYVTNYHSGTLSVINTSSNSVVATVPVGAQASAIAVSRDGTNVYVGSVSGGMVSVIDTSTNTVATTLPTGAVDDLVLSPSGNRLFVSSNTANTVTVINRPTNNILRTITGVSGALGMAVHPDGRKLYVGNYTGNTLTVINTRNNSITGTITLPSAQYGLAISPSGDKLYVSHHLSNQVSVINTATEAVTTFAVPGTPLGLSLDSTGSKLVVARRDANAVSIFDTSTNTLIASVNVGSAPHAFGRMVSDALPTLIAPSITSAPPAAGAVGIAYADHQFIASGTAPFNWSVSIGSLPPGLSLDPVTGVLTGTPTTSGSFAFTVQVSNLFGTAAIQAVTIAVATGSNFAIFNTGVAAVGELALAGSIDRHYTLIASAEPSLPGPNAIVATQIASGYWLNNGPNSQWIAPSANQSYPGASPCNAGGLYTYRTTFDLTGFNPATAVINGAWAVDNAGSAIRLNGANLTGLSSTNYSALTAFTLNSGFVAGLNTLEFDNTDGGCPNGLRVELTGTAVITTPSAPLITSAAPPAGQVGVAYQHAFSATAVPIAITWSVTLGALPAGLSLNPTTGVLSGTPTASGTFNFTLQASNGVGGPVTQGMTLAVAPAAATTLTLSSVALNFGGVTQGQVASPNQTITVTNTGANPLVITSIPLSGASQNDFSISDTCIGNSIPSMGTCTITLGFTALGLGSRVAQADVISNATGSPNVISLAGTAVAMTAPTMTVAVNPSNVAPGAPAKVTLTLATPLGLDQYISSGVVAMPAGLTIQSLPAPTSSCIGGSPPSVAGGDTELKTGVRRKPASLMVPSITGGGTGLVFSAGVIPAAPGSCVVTFDVVSANVGDYSISVLPGNLNSYSGTNTNTSSTVLAVVLPGPSIDLNLGSIDFGSQGVGLLSSAQTVTLTNIGSPPLTIAGFTVTGDFSYTSNCPLSPASIPSGANCTIDIRFTPLTPTEIVGRFAVNSDAVFGSNSVLLYGRGVTTPQPNISLSASSLGFGDQAIGSTSPIQSVIVTNTGTATLTISGRALNSAAIAAGLSLVAGPADPISPNPPIPATILNCGGSLAPGASCYISVIFSPLILGNVSAAALNITHNATSTGFGTAIRSISLNGNGTARREPSIRVTGGNAGLNNANLSFADQVIGTAGLPKSLSITNVGTANLTISSTLVSALNAGTNVEDFLLGGNCTTTIIPNASCGLTVSFTPSGPIGNKSASLIVSSNAVNASQPSGTTTVGLSGLAMPIPIPIVKLSATTIGFGSAYLGAVASQKITVTNVGQLPLEIARIQLTGDYQQTNTCATPLNPQQACAIDVVFNPQRIGSHNSSLVITSNATPTTNWVPLTGTGCLYPSFALLRILVNNCGN